MFTTRAANLAVWLALALTVAALQVSCVARRAPASLGAAVAALRSRSAGRLLLASGWLWFGWHVFVRGSW
jgi:hypothetical protein